MAKKIQLYDCVQLKTGGPLMIVSEIIDKNRNEDFEKRKKLTNNHVYCEWLLGDKLVGNWYSSRKLKKIEQK